MPRYIQLIEDIIKKSMKKGYSKSGEYEAFYLKPSGVVTLKHYGTIIFQGSLGQIYKLGGYSKSDKNAISTAMRILKIPGTISSARKYEDKNKRNGWYIIPEVI